MTGIAGRITIEIVVGCELPFRFEATSLKLYWPSTTGTPETRPVLESSERPTGKSGVSEKLPGLLSALSWNWKTEPTLPEAESALVMLGLAELMFRKRICAPVPLALVAVSTTL